MKATTAFEHLRDALRAQLEAAPDASGTIAALTMALEKIACELAQDEEDERARQRQQAVLALARRAPQILRAARAEGELRVARQDAPAPEKRRFPRMQAAGLLVLAALAVAQLADGKPLYAALQAAGAALLAWGAMKPASPARAGDDVRAAGVQRFDAAELLRFMAELCAAVDVCTDDLSLLSDEGAARGDTPMDGATLDLLLSLLEARATGDGEVALRSLDQAEQALRARGVELVSYDAEHASLFDLLPTRGEARTVRPALLLEGRLLRRGVAVCRMERGVSA